MTSQLPTSLPTAARTRRAGLITVVLALLAGLLGAQLVGGQAASARVATHGRTGYEFAIARGVVRMINAERRVHHLKPLSSRRSLQASARRHNVTMSQFNVMSHQLPREAAPGTRMRTAGYKWRWAGENIAWNSEMDTRGVNLLETLMYNEKPPNDGHRLNILSPHYHNVGVDVYIDRTHHKVWLTTDFGAH